MEMEDAKKGSVQAVLLQLPECPDMCDPEEDNFIRESTVGVDDVTGEPLDPVRIRKARGEEMQGFRELWGL